MKRKNVEYKIFRNVFIRGDESVFSQYYLKYKCFKFFGLIPYWRIFGETNSDDLGEYISPYYEYKKEKLLERFERFVNPINSLQPDKNGKVIRDQVVDGGKVKIHL